MAAYRALAAFAVVAVVGASVYLYASRGRTPGSGFVMATFGSDAPAFERTYDGGGSSEDDGRMVVLRTALEPEQVLGKFLAHGGWRRLGEAIDRPSDGLCVVAWSAEEYLSGHHEAGAKADVRAVIERERQVVVLSLLYC